MKVSAFAQKGCVEGGKSMVLEVGVAGEVLLHHLPSHLTIHGKGVGETPYFDASW